MGTGECLDGKQGSVTRIAWKYRGKPAGNTQADPPLFQFGPWLPCLSPTVPLTLCLARALDCACTFHRLWDTGHPRDIRSDLYLDGSMVYRALPAVCFVSVLFQVGDGTGACIRNTCPWYSLTASRHLLRLHPVSPASPQCDARLLTPA